MGIFLDIVVVVILLAFITLGYKKGFIKSVMGLVSLGLSVILAVNFYAYPADFINDRFIEPFFAQKTSETFESLMNGGTETINPDKILEDKPDSLTEILDKFGIDINTVTEYYENHIKPTTDYFDTVEISDKLSEFIVGSTADTVSNIVGFLAVFLISLIILNLLLKLLDLLFKLPVLKFTNRLFGGALGLIKGIVVAIVIVNVVSALVFTVGDLDNGFLSQSSLKKSTSYTTIANVGLVVNVGQ